MSLARQHHSAAVQPPSLPPTQPSHLPQHGVLGIMEGLGQLKPLQPCCQHLQAHRGQQLMKGSQQTWQGVEEPAAVAE